MGMSRRHILAVSLVAVAIMVLTTGAAATAPTGDAALLVEVDGPITPVVADYLADAREEAEAAGSILIVRIDTPGGLDQSMRDIVQSFLNSPVPVVAYVAPEGARAASAGTFITMAAHVAAMAPATSIGAATPVDLQGGEITDKVINDAAAFAVSLAERTGRSAEFAEAAVRDGESITAIQAVEQGVVDLQADDVDDLLAQIDGMSIEVMGDPVTLSTDGMAVENYEPGILREVLAQIANPNIAFILLSFGTLAIVYEAANPGLGFAGIAGVIALVLGFFALSVLPVTAAGIALLVLAAALFIGEIFVPGVGVLAAGGTIALLLSGFFLFEGVPSVRPPILWPTALVVGGAAALAGRLAWRARRAAPTTGITTLVGRKIDVEPGNDGKAEAFVDGSWWSVRSADDSPPQGRVEIVDIDGLELVVDKIGEEHVT